MTIHPISSTFGRGAPEIPRSPQARGKADGDGKQHYTNRVITLWYRPPELLYQAAWHHPRRASRGSFRLVQF